MPFDAASNRWSGPKTLEVSGDISVDSPGSKSVRGPGTVVVSTEPDGVHHLYWATRGGLLSRGDTGVVLGNFIIGHAFVDGVLVIRYSTLGNAQMQLAFRGQGSERLAAQLTAIAAAWQTKVDDSVGRRNGEPAPPDEPFNAGELAEITQHLGVLERVDDPDLGIECNCESERRGAVKFWECSTIGYVLVDRRQQAFDLEMPGVSWDDDEDALDLWDDLTHEFTLCVLCLRMAWRRNQQGG